MWRKVAYTVKVHTDVLLYSAYHNPVNAVKAVAMFGREIPLRKNNGIWFTALPGSKGDPALFRMESPGGRQGRHFPNAKATGFWEGISLKIGIAAVFSGHLATPNRTRELSCGFRWQPYGKLCCFCVAVTPGAKRCLATPRGYPKTKKKASARKDRGSGKKSVVFARTVSRENGSSAYRLRTAKPKTVPHTPPTICIKLATWSCTKSMP